MKTKRVISAVLCGMLCLVITLVALAEKTQAAPPVRMYNTAKEKLMAGGAIVGGTVSTSDPNIYCAMGDALNCEGQCNDAIAQFEKAPQLGPRDPLRWAFLGYGALAHLFAGDFESVIEWSEKAIRYPHCQYWAYAHRVAALGHLGRREEAREASAELLRQQPKFSLSLAEKKLYFVKRPEQLQLYFEGLRKAGVPQ